MAKVSKQSLAYRDYMSNPSISVQELANRYSVSYRTMCHMLYRERRKLGTVIENKRH